MVRDASQKEPIKTPTRRSIKKKRKKKTGTKDTSRSPRLTDTARKWKKKQNRSHQSACA